MAAYVIPEVEVLDEDLGRQYRPGLLPRSPGMAVATSSEVPAHASLKVAGRRVIVWSLSSSPLAIRRTARERRLLFVEGIEGVVTA